MSKLSHYDASGSMRRNSLLRAGGGTVTAVEWHGSGDILSMARANAYLVADPDRAEYPAGRYIRVLPK